MKTHRLALPHKFQPFKTLVCSLALMVVALASTALAQTSAFTYQGRLNDGDVGATGLYDMRFSLFSSDYGGAQLGGTLSSVVPVTNGLFTVLLDFGAAQFNGDARWLELGVRPSGSGAAHSTLTPRTPLSSTPYALYARTAGAVASGSVMASQLNTPAAPGAGQVLTYDGATLKWRDKEDISVGWNLNGNTIAGGEFIGTANDQPLELRANNVRGLTLASAARTTQSGSLRKTRSAVNIVAGHPENTVSNGAIGATISGGGSAASSYDTARPTVFFPSVRSPNVVSADFGTIGGGADNRAGYSNLGVSATVGGGSNNWANSDYSVIAGGQGNRIWDHSYGTIGGGLENSVSKSGIFFGTSIGGTVPGGRQNEASANYSFAAGHHAKARHNGAFVWADANGADFISEGVNQFSVRSTGGARFVTAINEYGDPTAGVRLESGWTSWGTISDRNAKKQFQPVDGKAVLAKLAQVPVTRWNYRWEADDATPHLGPMAQDFKAAFFPGRDDKVITTLEFDGVELAAIQGLNELVAEKEARIAALEDKLATLERTLASQQHTLARWENRLGAMEQAMTRMPVSEPTANSEPGETAAR